jgi:hypothetical protein
MKPEAQRIAIAKVCGWKLSNLGAGRYCWAHPKLCAVGGPSVLPNNDAIGLPDYLNDLNAMHEAEKVLTYKQGGEMTVWIERMTCAGYGPQLFATAAQRAEAFLRTLNLWDDSK